MTNLSGVGHYFTNWLVYLERFWQNVQISSFSSEDWGKQKETRSWSREDTIYVWLVEVNDKWRLQLQAALCVIRVNLVLFFFVHRKNTNFVKYQRECIGNFQRNHTLTCMFRHKGISAVWIKNRFLNAGSWYDSVFFVSFVTLWNFSSFSFVFCVGHGDAGLCRFQTTENTEAQEEKFFCLF